jgi:hypothetical protein
MPSTWNRVNSSLLEYDALYAWNRRKFQKVQQKVGFSMSTLDTCHGHSELE